MLGAPVDHSFRVDLRSGTRRHVGFQLVLTQLGGHRQNRAIQNVRVPLDHVLHFLRGDVLPAAADDVLLPVHEIKEAVLVHPAQVAGIEPAVAQRLLGLLLVAPITGHDSRVLDGDFANCVHAYVLAGLRVGDAHLVVEAGGGVLTGQAGRTGPALATDAFDSPVAGLGHAEADDNVGPEPYLEL